MLKVNIQHQVTTISQGINDRLIGFKYMHSGKQWRVFKINPVVTYRVINLDVIVLTNVKVVHTVSWRGMHTTGTRVGSHVLTQYD